MIDSDLDRVYHLITQAFRPEDIFKFTDLNLPSDMLQQKVDKKYQQLKKKVNPDTYSGVTDSEYARDASDQLDRFYDLATHSIESGTYGIEYLERKSNRTHKSFQIGDRKYFLGPEINKSELFTFYQGFLDLGESFGEVVVKVANSIENNMLIQNEIRILHQLYSIKAPQRKHIPVLLNHFDAGNKKAIIYRKISGYNFREILQKYSQGIDQKHMVWMLDRLLSLMGYSHNQGIIHGHLSPSHIMIRPNNHNAFVLGWGNAMWHNELQGKIIESNSIFMAPELKNGGVIGPWSDIFSLGKLMIFILGGDIEVNELPEHIDPKIVDFLLSMVHTDQVRRPSDAWDLYEHLTMVKDSLWERKFLHFNMN